jgi:hypothetical protein
VRVLRELERPLLPGRKQSRQIRQVIKQGLPRGQQQPRDLLLNQSRVLYPRRRTDASRSGLLKRFAILDSLRDADDRCDMIERTHNVPEDVRAIVAVRLGLLELQPRFPSSWCAAIIIEYNINLDLIDYVSLESLFLSAFPSA